MIVNAANGYVLTNHHVVESAKEIEVVLQDNRSLKAKVVGSDLDKLDLRHIHGGFETRLAQRSRVPAVILGAGDAVTGGSSLNAGNYQQTRRLWSDTWFTPTADGLCAALERIVPPPDLSTELSFDPAAVTFLQEDIQDRAEIQFKQSQATRNLLDAGFVPETAVDAVISDDDQAPAVTV